ncbi:hypothetical protein ACIQI8_43630 [Streptomyces sp. NPDC092369]|uniref:hypothetical protein n=1 Tax=Streptomyces sp. NPDC092369 TaxID=3366015 RepID=UPI00382D5B22
MGQLKARAAVAIAVAASLSLSAGCTAHNGQQSPGRTPPSATSSGSPSAIVLPSTPPDISGSTKALVRLADRTGSEEVAVIDSIEGGTVAVATECAGEGVTKIVVGGLSTYTIPCEAAPSETYNEIGLRSARKHVKIVVTAGTGIHWGLSVGWRSEYQTPPS